MSSPASAPADLPPAPWLERARRVFAAWMGFWFAPANLATLGLIRIAGGLTAFYVILCYTPDLDAMLGRDAWVDLQAADRWRKELPVAPVPSGWEPIPFKGPLLRQDYASDEEYQKAVKEWQEYYQEWEADPRLAQTKGRPIWSIFYHVSDPVGVRVVHCLTLLCLLLLAAGLGTRLAAPLSWVLYVSYLQRASTFLFGMDTMLNILLIYLMLGAVLGATGARYSLDDLLARWLVGRGKAAPLPPDVEQRRRRWGNFVLRLFQIHFCLIYIASGLSKLQGGSWWNGTAQWGVLCTPEFNPMHVSLYFHLMTFLCQHRWLWEVTMHGIVLFTLGLEIGFPFLVWNRRTRWAMVVGATLLHTGIALFMGLVGFGLAMLSMLLAFIPGETSERFVNWLAEQVRPVLAMLSRPAPDKARELALGKR